MTDSARPIYLDYQATTPCDPSVVDAMRPYFVEEFGNPASRTHPYGWRAREAVEDARRRVAGLIGARAREIVFTSGATESNNLAILGAARARSRPGAHVVTCRTEHRAVLDPVGRLEREGFRVTRLGVRPDGRLDLERLRDALLPETVLISLMHANNEIGVVQDLASVGALARERGIWLHSDAAQSAGRIETRVNELQVDLLSLSGHKLYGPKGVGALYVRRGRRLEPLIYGGGHEAGLRSGTLPVPLCVGFGAACALSGERMDADARGQAELRDHLWRRLSGEIDGVWLNGASKPRLPGNLNLGIEGVASQELLAAVPELALSSGSACTSAVPEPSHVLGALGLSPERALECLRISLGRGTRPADVDRAADLLAERVGKLRARRR